MAKRWYTKEAQYTLPAWNPVYVTIDGIYIDSYLFENNITVLDSTLSISVQPDTWHICSHGINFSLPTFKNGVVEFLYKYFSWLPGQSHAQSDKIFCNGHPYGMGLNPMGITCAIIIGGLIGNPIIYDVSFTMEVET